MLYPAFAASVWINDKFINTTFNGADETNTLFTFPQGSVITGKDNVVTVLQDNMGNDEDSNGTRSSSILGFCTLSDPEFSREIGARHSRLPAQRRQLYDLESPGQARRI